MAFIDQPEPPAPWRVALGLIAATAVPFFWFPSGGHGAPMALFACPPIVFVFFPLVLWRLPRARSPLLTAVALGALTEPLLLAVIFFDDLLRSDPVRPIASFMAAGTTAGLAYWLVVACGNPYFSDEARRNRASL
jgi:hypothetical protein